jgi:hypothetical protein
MCACYTIHAGAWQVAKTAWQQALLLGRLQGNTIEDDLPEYADDRGHSSHHPGYRRRQLRFLAMKLFSQVSSFLYFLTVVPVLRYGPNKRRFPFSELIDGTPKAPKTLLLDDTLLDNNQQFLTRKAFNQAMIFAGEPHISRYVYVVTCAGVKH